MDKGWRDYFLARNKLRICHLIQNSFQFKLLNKIGKVLASKLEKFSKSNSANPSLIIIFDEVTNLFTLRTAAFGTADLNIGCYIALNRVLSSFKKLLAQFFMLSIESRVEKFLPPDIPTKEAEKKTGNPWSNLSSCLPLPSTSE